MLLFNDKIPYIEVQAMIILNIICYTDKVLKVMIFRLSFADKRIIENYWICKKMMKKK